VTVETGSAVMLCSLTTTIGYLATHAVDQQGIKSFGASAAVGGSPACSLRRGASNRPAVAATAAQRRPHQRGTDAPNGPKSPDTESQRRPWRMGCAE
jgi:hypothetical protein